MSIEVRTVESEALAELHLTIRPAVGSAGPVDYAGLYRALARLLREERASLFAERLLVPEGETAPIATIRSEALGDLDDGVPPTIIESPSLVGRGVGLQVQALRGEVDLEPVRENGEPVGRLATAGARRWLRLAALTAAPTASAPEQATEVYARAARILRGQHMRMNCVARTWVWMRDILDWYDEFNAARNAFFQTEGLLNSQAEVHFMPASTGIGAAPANGLACGLEVLAISDGDISISASHAAGEQCSAFCYGSAFARAVTAPSPAGSTLLVSGTAAIDTDGVSEHPGDIEAQIDATLQHIRALIEEAGWREEQVRTATVYCKTTEVADLFAVRCGTLDWPRVELLADVCRPELLFEAEVTLAGSEVISQDRPGTC
jgi:enamine deaminase RidA (YjgF/YER057c/UK114 family)